MTLTAFFSRILGAKKKVTRKTITQYQQDILVRSGKEQFQYLLKKNIRIPVVLL